MARVPKAFAPPPRGLTVAEKRSYNFERVALVVVLVVALMAATVSFVAMTWLGRQMGLYLWLAPFIPLVYDGLGIACSVGIIRSQASAEDAHKRRSEWVGLAFSLGVSIAGNIAHVLNYAPDSLKVVVAAGVPVVVAYALHVYGRALVGGISRFMLAEERGVIHLDIQQLGDAAHTTAQPSAQPAAQPLRPVRAQAPVVRASEQPTEQPVERASQTPAAQPATAQPQPAPARSTPTVVPVVVDVRDDDLPTETIGGARLRPVERPAYQAFLELAKETGKRPLTPAVMERAGMDAGAPSTPRRWVDRWWTEYEAVALGAPDRDQEQLNAEHHEEARVTA